MMWSRGGGGGGAWRVRVNVEKAKEGMGEGSVYDVGEAKRKEAAVSSRQV